jgi:hypothetical protein
VEAASVHAMAVPLQKDRLKTDSIGLFCFQKSLYLLHNKNKTKNEFYRI